MFLAKHGALFFRNHYATLLGIYRIKNVAIYLRKGKSCYGKQTCLSNVGPPDPFAGFRRGNYRGWGDRPALLTNQFSWRKRSVDVSLAEEAPQGISDPNAVTDEQNSIEVYKSISPGVAFINTTSYQRDFWGGTQEGKGNGSGSVIDSSGHILTNYHVIEGAQKLSVSFGGEKNYPATLVGGDPDTDLAVIKIDPPRPA